MDAPALYDLAPALRLMLMGLVLAGGPLAWVWLRQRQASTTRRLQALTVLTLFLTFDLVLFGAFTRLKAGVEGMIHVSELDHKRVHRVTDVLKEGQDVEAMTAYSPMIGITILDPVLA